MRTKKLFIPLLCWVASLTGCGGGGEETSSGSSSSSSSASSGSGSPVSSLDKWNFILGINVGGGSYRDTKGLTFEADQYFWRHRPGGGESNCRNATAGAVSV
ncbi:hypothetical protein DWB84_07740 [Saccharophagus sp. K07]|uniref:hypothetical protein n=1 Tax=Saccharophagus sp. K07 TaxID=2283636 RepID=UPI001651E8B5|nr:hypothetical protein [Saccharophagus sp. K07]MBC6905347.1 hypothetical protein [Saccharophagus sp. K07]